MSGVRIIVFVSSSPQKWILVQLSTHTFLIESGKYTDQTRGDRHGDRHGDQGDDHRDPDHPSVIFLHQNLH